MLEHKSSEQIRNSSKNCSKRWLHWLVEDNLWMGEVERLQKIFEQMKLNGWTAAEYFLTDEVERMNGCGKLLNGRGQTDEWLMKSFERQKLNCWMAVVWFWMGDCTCERPNNWMNIPAVKNITIHELQQEQIMVLIWELTESKTSQKTNPVAEVKLLRNKANSFSLEKSKSKVPVCQYVHICAYIRTYTSLCFAFLALLVKQDIIFMGMKKASKWNLHIIKRHADQWELSYFEFLITLQIHRQTTVSLTLAQS